MISKILLCHAFMCCLVEIYGQQKAITETGETVVLYNDGRWTYMERDTLLASEIPLNPEKFEKSEKSTFLLKSTRVGIGCWLDPKKWTFQKAEDHDAAEYEINNDEKGLYGLLITEKIELPVENLANIALDNARDVAPDVKIINKEYRDVNGLKVLMLRMTGTIQDILFSYYGYYYSNDQGAVQFLVYSSRENIDANIEEIETLLNGFTTIDK